jgi:hypothetical protein
MMGTIRRTGVVTLAALALSTPLPAQETVSEGAQWEARPSQADFERLGPPDAVRSRTPGRATLDCSLEVSGRLRDCKVKDESPAGAGFGASALKLAPLYRLARTKEVDLDGSRLTFAVRFRYAPLDPPPPSTATPVAAAAATATSVPFTAPPGRMTRIAAVPGWQVEFLDLERLMREGGFAETYRLTIYAASRESGDSPGVYEISKLRIDCASGAQQFGGAQVFSRDGRLVALRPPAATAAMVDPGGVEAMIGEIACDPGAAPRTDATGFQEAFSAARSALGDAP